MKRLRRIISSAMTVSLLLCAAVLLLWLLSHYRTYILVSISKNSDHIRWVEISSEKNWLNCAIMSYSVPRIGNVFDDIPSGFQFNSRDEHDYLEPTIARQFSDDTKFASAGYHHYGVDVTRTIENPFGATTIRTLISVRYWILVAIAAAIPTWRLRRLMLRRVQRAEHCASCGYDLPPLPTVALSEEASRRRPLNAIGPDYDSALSQGTIPISFSE
jgi:hypothetical protein